MKFKQAVSTCFKKYVTFSGRASRSEYWYWALFCGLAGFIIGFCEGFTVGLNGGHMAFQPISTLFNLATILPSIAVSVRRLHDIDHSGWWVILFVAAMICMVFGEIMVVFTLIGLGIFGFLLYWMTKRGTMGDNRFGADPLAAAAT